ncbi:hypothetical protein HOP50_04g28280 [Chloropicon primus]|uniref:Uncharacterized protein n=1 Tax=Chloropicon primus TaxID=1764295 RepID=A0A5B8MLY3_9CHLO|nr:hypothetical protein A3770_04p28280 [Chloropicon primus]UPQ99520.1 hypothetical protein HOP50_04g28280 [Chloropicon primus]|eukprot:QDZ20310.1 hypothetical protein A3770_04p28280 [Chloropicon primus]
MVVFHSIHDPFHRDLVKKEKAAAKRSKLLAGGISSSGRLPSLTSNDAAGGKKKKKKKSKGKKAVTYTPEDRLVMKTPRIHHKGQGQGKQRVKKRAGTSAAESSREFVEIIEVPSDVPIRLVPLGSATPKKVKKAKKGKKKAKRKTATQVPGDGANRARAEWAASKAGSLEADRGHGGAEVESLLHQLSLERKKCHVLSQIVQEQGAFLENIQRHKSSRLEDLHLGETATPSRFEGDEEEFSSEAAKENYCDSESASPHFAARSSSRLKHSLNPDITDAINVLHLMEQEGERTRGELHELRKIARSFHDEIARSQAAEAAALEALSEAEARAAAAEEFTKKKKTIKLERVVSKLDATLTPSQSNEISILSGLASSESAASPAVTADHKHDYQQSGNRSVTSSARKKVDKLYKRYLDESEKVTPRRPQMAPLASPQVPSRVSSAGSASMKKRRPRRSPQVGQERSNHHHSPRVPLQSSGVDRSVAQLSALYDPESSSPRQAQGQTSNVGSAINTLEDTLNNQHKTLEESKRLISDYLLMSDENRTNGFHHRLEPLVMT